MSRFLLPFLAAIASAILALGVGGCAWTQDERDFYGRGWVNPRDLDRPVPSPGLRSVPGADPADGTPTNPWATDRDSSINRQ